MDAHTPATPSSGGANPVQDNVGTSTYRAGPNASPIVFGLVAVIVGALIIASETLTWSLDWSVSGPGVLAFAGLALVVIAAIGLVRRHGDV